MAKKITDGDPITWNAVRTPSGAWHKHPARTPLRELVSGVD